MTAGPSERRPLAPPWWGWLRRVLAIWGIPAFILWASIGVFLELDRQAQTQERLRALESRLAGLRDDSEQYWPRLLIDRFFEQELRGRPASDSRSLAAHVDALLARHPPGAVDISLFDGAGRPIPVGFVATATTAMYGFARRPDTVPRPIPATLTTFLATVYPAPATFLRKLPDWRKWRRTTMTQGPRFSWMVFACDDTAAPDRVGGMLVAGHRDAYPTGMELQRVIEQQGRAEEAMVLRVEGRAVAAVPDDATTRRRLIGAADRCERLAQPWRIEDGWIVNPARVGPLIELVGAVPMPGHPRRLLAVAFLLYFVISFLLLSSMYAVLVEHRTCRIPLKLKLRAFYALALGVPLAVIVVMARLYIEDRRASISEQHRQHLLEQMITIDQRVRLQWHRQLRRYREVVTALRPHVRDRARLIAILNQTVPRLLTDQPVLIASTGQILTSYDAMAVPMRRWLLLPPALRKLDFRNWGDISARMGPRVRARFLQPGPRMATSSAELMHLLQDIAAPSMQMMFLKIISDGVMAEYDKRSTGASADIDHRTLMVDSLLSEDAQQLRGRAISRVDRYEEGWLDMKVFYDVLPGPDGRAWYFVGFYDQKYGLQYHYVRQVGRINGGLPPTVQLLILSFNRFRYLHPQQADLEEFEKELQPVRQEQVRDLVTTVVRNKIPMQLVAYRCASLEDYFLVALTPKSFFDATLAAETRQMTLGAIVLLALFLAFARLLDVTLLAPVAELGRGLAAMRERQYNVTLIPPTDDELGRLCQAFNQAIRRLQDMDLAHGLQSALTPAQRLVVGPYELVGRSAMLQDVGGDYYDFVPLPDGRVVVLLGDVSGHGIGAALVTAMAWSAVHTVCESGGNEPAVILERLNIALLEVVRKAKMMTMVLLILDPATESVMMANAGQTAPIRVFPDGRHGQIEMAGTPLGMTARARYKDLGVPFKSGALLLYSDGLVECQNTAEEFFGYPRFVKTAAGAIAANIDAFATFDRIVATVQQFTGPVPLEDDVTLVLLRRTDGR